MEKKNFKDHLKNAIKKEKNSIIACSISGSYEELLQLNGLFAELAKENNKK